MNQVLVGSPYCLNQPITNSNSGHLAVATKSAAVSALCLGAIVAAALSIIGVLSLAGILTLPLTASVSLLVGGLALILSLALVSVVAARSHSKENDSFGPFIGCERLSKSEEYVIDMQGVNCDIDCPFCECEPNDEGPSNYGGLCFAEEFGCSRCICPSCSEENVILASQDTPCTCSICSLGSNQLVYDEPPCLVKIFGCEGCNCLECIPSLA